MTELSKDKKRQIEDDALLLYPFVDILPKETGYHENDVAEHKQKSFIAGATAEATKSLILIEALEKIKENHYPESLFAPLTENEWDRIKFALKQWGFSVDRLSSHYGRILLKPDQQLAADALEKYRSSDQSTTSHTSPLR